MGKFRYLLLFVLLSIGILILIPDSPIYPLAADYVQKKMESRWNCLVLEKRISTNPLKGCLLLQDLSIKTPEAVNPTWHLQIESATLQIRYLSLIRNKTIDRLILDGVVLRQKHTEKAEIPPKPKPSQRKGPQGSESEPSSSEAARQGLRIRHLVIRNGSFESIHMDASGVRKSIKAEKISVARKNVYLDKRPDLFFRSLFSADTRF